MAIKYKELNINDAVKVKLSEAGHLEMERQHNELYKNFGIKHRPFTRKAVDKDGYSTFQLHTLMHTFGHLMMVGNDKLPFESCSILIANLLLKDTNQPE